MAVDESAPPLSRLQAVLENAGPCGVAVSGGVDSMTLAVLAGRHCPDVTMFHAVSPAVPSEATERVKRYAQAENWRLEIFDAGEFADPRYRANPVNRCYFCKTNLYGAIAARTERQVWSGTNTDDLGDYRPGLVAADEHAIDHPYVAAGIDKATVRALARMHHLDDLSELPAAPCLSSRVETGIAIDANDLQAIHRVETLVGAALNPKTVRCRVRSNGVVVELDEASMTALETGESTPTPEALVEAVQSAFAQHRPGISVSFSRYAMGSAFVHGPIGLATTGASNRGAAPDSASDATPSSSAENPR